MPKKNGFQALLYTRFITEKQYRVAAVAEKMGVHKDTLYKWVNGTNPFSIDYLAALVVATEDPTYLEYQARDAGYKIIPQIKDKKTAEIIQKFAELMLSCISKEEEK